MKLGPLPSDAHYWKYLFVSGQAGKYLDLEKQATWARHSPAAQQRLIKHGYAPAFVLESACQ